MALYIAGSQVLRTPRLYQERRFHPGAQTIAITGGTVALGDGSEPIPGGTVVVRDGRIVAAGRGVAVPAGAQIVDATGKWVTPGIVAGFSRIGLVEVDAVDATNAYIDASIGAS